MKLKCVVRDESGAVHLIVNDFNSVEMAYAELESDGYRVYSISLSDPNEFIELI